MQANNIVIRVIDRLAVASQVVLSRLYKRSREELDKSTYVGPLNSLAARDWLQFYRSAPKRSGESRGTSKSTIKFTIDEAVPNASGSGDIVLPVILEVNFSIPVGCSEATFYELVNRAHGILLDPVLVTNLLYDPATNDTIYQDSENGAADVVTALAFSNPGEV